MRKVLLLIIFCLSNLVDAQTFQINGKILNKKTNQWVSYAEIKINKLQKSFSANAEGEFEIKQLKSGKYILEISHVGFAKEIKEINLINDLKNFEITISPKDFVLKEASVVDIRLEKKSDDFIYPLEIETETEIEKQSKISLADLVENKSGISIIKDSPWATSINIRGMRNNNLVYLIDGNRIETSTNLAGGLSMFNLSEIQQVEIVKGGLSSIYGSGATGGVLSITSKRESFTNKFQVNANGGYSYNSVNNGNYENLSLSAMSSNYFLKLSGSYRKADDTIIPNGILTNSGFQDNSYSGLLSFLILENLKINFEYQKFNAKNVGLPGGAAFPENATATYKTANRELIATSIFWNSPIPNLSEIKMKIYKQVIFRDVEIRPNAVAIVNPKATHTTYGVLLQSNWVVNNSDILVFGLETWQRSYDGIRSTLNTSLNKEVFDKPVPNSSYLDFGVFVNYEKPFLSKKIETNLGLRYDYLVIKNEKTYNPQMIIDNGNIIYPPANEIASYDENNEVNKSYSGNIGAKYNFNENYSVSINSAYAFRSPSLEERFQYINLGGIVYLGNHELKPEISNSFDFGFTFLSNSMRIKFNLYDNELKNLVVDDIVFTDSIYQKANVGKARLYGAEFTFEKLIFSGLKFYTNASYVVGKNLINENHLPQIPPLNGNIKISYTFFDNLNLIFENSMFAQQKNVDENENKTAGYSIFNFRVFYSHEIKDLINLGILFGVDNIFNKSYRNHLSTYRGISLTEPGRNIYLKINFNF